MANSLRPRACRAIAAVLVACSAGIGLGVPLAGSSAPNQTAGATSAEAGYWTRALPFQDDSIEGQSTSSPVIFASPSQVPGTTVPTIPGPQSPPTTPPPPLPFPTIPQPPVTTPPVDSGFSNPGVPDGGLWVANDSTGAYAIGAIRFRGDIGAARLQLKFASGSSPFGPIVACPAISQWQSETGGAWSNRPAHGCDALEVTGRRNEAGDGVVFDIPAGFSTFGVQELSMVVLPNRDTGDVFSLLFEAPTADSLEVFGGQPLPDIPDEPTTTTTTSAAPPTTRFVAPRTPQTTFTPAPTAPPTTAGSDDQDVALPAAPSNPTAPPSNPVASVVELFEDDPLARYLSMGLLLAMGAAFFYYGGHEPRAPRLLGGMAGTAAPVSTRVDIGIERGIGRFRRSRDDKPGRL